MKYLKKIEDWRNRYDFLEDGPEFFVCYFPNGIVDGDGDPKYDGAPYIWYHDKGGEDTVDGYKYVFYKPTIVKNSNYSFTIHLDKPLITNVTITTHVVGSLNGGSITGSSTRNVNEGATIIEVPIQTVFTLSGQRITLQNGDDLQLDDFNFTITQPDGTYTSKGVIIFTE